MELAALFVLLGLVWLTSFALFASSLSSLLRTPPIKKAIDAVTGTVLVGFGVRRAAEAR